MPAVGREDGAGAVARRRARQVDRQADYLFRRGDAAERHVLEEAAERRLVLPQRRAELGADQAGADGVDADAIAAPLLGQDLGQANERRLADAVEAQQWLGAEAA